jgi:hypothetical protein
VSDVAVKTRPVLDLNDRGAWLTNLDVPGRRPGPVLVVGTILCLLASWISWRQYSGDPTPGAFLPMVLSTLAMLAIWFVNKLVADKPQNWLSPDVIFVLMFSVFHFAYIVYYAFGLVMYDHEVFFNPEKAPDAVFFSQCCLAAFLVAYELAGALYPLRQTAAQLVPCDRRIILASQAIVLTAIVFMLAAMVSVGIGRLMQDYSLMTEIGYTPLGRFFWVAHSLGVVGLVLHCAASGLTRRRAMSGIVFPVLALGFIMFVLLLGDRGGFIQVAIIPLAAFYYFQNKIRWRWAAGMVLVLMFAMGVVGAARTRVTLDPRGMLQEYQLQAAGAEQDFVSRTLVEFGFSLKTVVIAMDLVPGQCPYWFGRSYLDGLQYVVPNVIPGLVRGGRGLVAWLNEEAFGSMRWTHGRGGSIAMEAFVNFGFVGGIAWFVVVGALYRVVYERFLARPNLLRAVLLLAAIVCLMLWVRNSSMHVPRLLVWPLLTAWILQFIWKPEPAAEPSRVPT